MKNGIVMHQDFKRIFSFKHLIFNYLKFRFIDLWLLLLLAPLALSAQGTRSLTVESIALEGNNRTRAYVIKNYLDLAEGDQITEVDIKAARMRLENTGFFKNVELLIKPGTERGNAALTVQVEENSRILFDFQSGYNELDGWYIHPLGVRFDNIFGRGNYLSYHLVIGDRIAGAELEYVRPYIFGSEYDFEAMIYGYQRDFVHFVSRTRFKQNVEQNGLMLRVSGNSGLARYFSLAYFARSADADSSLTLASDDSTLIDAPVYLSSFSGINNIQSLILTFTTDTRDSKLYPTSGWWGSIALEESALPERDGFDFTKLTVDVRRYQTIYKQLVAAFRLKWGRVSEEAPFYEKFYLGGPNSLRGYQDRRLTPAGYAANKTLGSAEIRFPLSGRIKDPTRFTGVLFYDAGYAWNEPDSWELKNLELGLGYGVRFRLPIVGIVRMDFAYPVPEYEFRFHLSLGHTF